MDPSLAIALSVFIISYALLASERINRTVVVALAFFVVVFSACTPSESKPTNYENGIVSAKSSVFTRRRSGVRIASSPSVFCQSDAIIVAEDEDDKEEKLPTSKELPTSADDGNKQEEQPETVIVEVPGGIIVYGRDSDGKLDNGHEFSTEELISHEAISDVELQKAERIKTIDYETILAVQEIQEADNKPLIQVPDSNGAAEIQQPRPRSTSGDLELHFSQSDLDNFVALRKTGLAPKSLDWIDRASNALRESTKGELSRLTLMALRQSVLDKYTSPHSHSKVLSFAAAFLKFLVKQEWTPSTRPSRYFLKCRKQSKSGRA